MVGLYAGLLLLAGGCASGGDTLPHGEGDAGPGSDTGPAATDTGASANWDGGQGPSLAFVSPTPRAELVADAVRNHAWAARVPLTVTTTGIARVRYFMDPDTLLDSSTTPPFDGVGLILSEGPHLLTAVGFDARGDEVARDEVLIRVLPTPDPSCYAMLDALGLDWAFAGATQGITDPVYVQPTIRGVSFRGASQSTPRAALMACELAPRLVELAELAFAYGFDEVVHLGIYNYRCIGGGDPGTGCTPSQHAFARAIDLHSFNSRALGRGVTVRTDWQVSSVDPVCPGTPVNIADRTLHEIACTMWSDRIFEIVLTPDYNAAHRDHFHVDMTSGSRFIGETVSGVDPLIPGLGD